MRIPIGIEVSTDNTNWYKLTDHNRNPIQIKYDLVQNEQRMADGTLRKYIVARKFKITADWNNLPTLDSNLVDYKLALGDVKGNAKAAAWIKAFYEANVFFPVWIKLRFAKDSTPAVGSVPSASTYVTSEFTDGQIFNAYMSSFTYDIQKRNGSYDYVNCTIEFTEI